MLFKGLHAESDGNLCLLAQGCVVEVEGIVKGRLCFTVLDREGLHIARLGSPDLNFAPLWIKVLPCYRPELRARLSAVKAQVIGNSTGNKHRTMTWSAILGAAFLWPALVPDPCPAM